MFVVRRKCGQDRRSIKQSSKITEVPLVACASKNFHSNRVADCNLGCKQFLDAITCC